LSFKAIFLGEFFGERYSWFADADNNTFKTNKCFFFFSFFIIQAIFLEELFAGYDAWFGEAYYITILTH
jgi:hypothetical protein